MTFCATFATTRGVEFLFFFHKYWDTSVNYLATYEFVESSIRSIEDHLTNSMRKPQSDMIFCGGLVGAFI